MGSGPRKPLATAPASEWEEAKLEVVGHATAGMERVSRPCHLPDVTPKLCATTPTLKLLTASLFR